MAIYHLSINILSRSKGYSAVAASAYRSGTAISDERTGLLHDYSRKRGVTDCVILAPDDAPPWCLNRHSLWNAVEKAERRKDSQLAREIELAIPRELSADTSRDTVAAFVRERFVRQGMIADVAFHHLDGDNPHTHIMLTLRDYGEAGFGRKVTDWNCKTLAEAWREAWAEHANAALEAAGYQETIDHRSCLRQGTDTIPGIHLGKATCAMAKRGIETERSELNRLIHKLNLEIRVSRVALSLRDVQQQNLALTDLSRRVADTLHIAIPENASSHVLHDITASLPEDCHRAWAMTDEAIALNAEMENTLQRWNDLKAQHADASRRVSAWEKYHPFSARLSQLPRMQWACQHYADAREKIQSLTPEMSEVNHRHQQIKDHRIPASQQAFEVAWNTWLCRGLGELKQHLVKQAAEAENRRRADALAVRLQRNDNLTLQPGEKIQGVVTGFGVAPVPDRGQRAGYMLLENRAATFTLWGDGLETVAAGYEGQSVTAYMTSDDRAWSVHPSSPGTAIAHDVYEQTRAECVRVYSAETFRRVMQQVCDGWPEHMRGLYRPACQPEYFYLGDDRRPVLSPNASSRWTDITRAVAPEQLTPVLGSVVQDSRDMDLLLVQGADDSLAGAVRLAGTLYPAFAVPSEDYRSLVISALTDNGLRFAGYGAALNRSRASPHPAPLHMVFRLKQRDEPLIAQMYTPEKQSRVLFHRLGFEQTWDEWERARLRRDENPSAPHRGMSL